MSGLNYITDLKGERTHLLIPLHRNKKISLEYVEDIQDIIAYELLKNDESVDYISAVNKILKSKK